MAGWLMGIVGVVALGVLLDILLPSGEINKYIKGIFGIVVVFVIVAPLPKLFDKNVEDYLIPKDGIVEYDEDYVNKINEQRNEEREAKLLVSLNNICTVERVSITYSKKDYYDISAVKLTISRANESYIDRLSAQAAKSCGVDIKAVKIIIK